MGSALAFCGKDMTVEELLKLVMEDKEFYIQSGGGVTLSGGECLCQADFCAAFMKELKRFGIACNIDTCGYVDKAEIDKVMPYTDMFLYDIKHIDPDEHKRYTGKSNERIVENLRYISSCGKNIEVRIPIIPSVNDKPETMHKIGKLLCEIDTLIRVRLLPYNNLAGSKYEILGRKNTMPKIKPPSREKLEEISGILKEYDISVADIVSS